MMSKASKVLITRPEPAASQLVKYLKLYGFDSISMPMVNISPIVISPEKKQKAIIDLDYFNHVIVVSPNAARISLDAMTSYWPQWPVQQSWYGVGLKTVSCLEALGLKPLHPQDRFDSEGLLQLPSLQVLSHQKVLIIKGKGGRELIAQTCMERGAKVDYLDVYERLPIDYPNDKIHQLCSPEQIAYVVISSGEILDHWLSLLRKASMPAHSYKLLVPSQRVAKIAQNAGIQDVYNCGGADNAAILSTLNKMTNRNAK